MERRTIKIIAETASNHMGQMKYLKELTLKCWEAGADLVTVQIFKLDAFVTSKDPSYVTFKKIEIIQNDWGKFIDWSTAKNIKILPCILDEPSMELCYNKGIRKIKIHASDILNTEFLKKCNDKFDVIFLEFGGADLEEIQNAVNCFTSSELILLYGFNAYPTKIENQNLEFIATLKNLFNVEVGFCDHTLETDIIPIMAMTKGAKHLEKHVTLEKNNSDRYDWNVSIDPKDISIMRSNLDKYSSAIGLKLRNISENEKHFRKLIYKKIVANDYIGKNSKIKNNDISYKRATEGLEINFKNKIIGKIITQSVKKDTIIKKEMIDE